MGSSFKKKVHGIIGNQSVQSVTSQKILDYIEKLLETVSIDDSQLKKKMEEAFNDSEDKNFLQTVTDTIVGIFGMKLIYKDKKISIDKSEIEKGNLLLTINCQKAEDIISAIITLIEELQIDAGKYIAEKRRMDEAVTNANRNTENIRQKLDALQYESEQKDKMTLQSIQRILAQHPELMPASENEQNALLLYFEDLGLTWSWNADDVSDDFTTYTISDAAAIGIRLPCLYRNGKRVLKGLKYEMKL